MLKKALGTHDIARICQVTPPTAIRWIEEGKLPSFTTGGGHRRVWERDLVVFLKKHNIPVPAGMEGGELKILIADDESGVRETIARSLHKTYPSAEIYQAEDGFEAGRKTSSVLPALLILDLQLPGASGFDVCQAIRSAPELKDIKILAITGHDIEASKKRVKEAGADDFLGKPFEMSKMIRIIERLLT